MCFKLQLRMSQNLKELGSLISRVQKLLTVTKPKLKNQSPTCLLSSLSLLPIRELFYSILYES